MFVHAATRSLLLQADPAVIMAAVPAREVAGGSFNIAAKHTVAATKKLREMGFKAPSPIVSYYDWPKFQGKFNPFEHQKIMAEFMSMNRRCFNLGEMGTGKTNSVLWALDWGMNEGTIDKTMIISPLSTLERVWLNGAVETIMHRRVVVVHGSAEKRLKLLATDADIYVINHDGLKIQAVRDAIKRRRDINHFVVDEGSKFRNAKNDRYRCLEQIVQRPEVGLWWLTGTPCPKSPADAWAQVRLVSPGRVPRFFGSFRMQVETEVSEHMWKPKKGHQEIVHAAMQPAVIFAKKDCLDLPPMTVSDIACEMSVEQKKAYKEMADAMQTASVAGQAVTAVNAADRINKLRQIMLGSVKYGVGMYQTYDYAPRLKVLLEAIENASAKVLVIAPFKGIIQDLAQQIGKHYSVAVVNGDVPIAKRNKIFADFKMDKDPHVLLCHPEVMSHGLNLTEADTLIFFGPIYSNDIYRQVIERINRPPQTKNMTMIRIGCNAIEWAIYKSLDSDEAQQTLILDLYKQVLAGA